MSSIQNIHSIYTHYTVYTIFPYITLSSHWVVVVVSVCVYFLYTPELISLVGVGKSSYGKVFPLGEILMGGRASQREERERTNTLNSFTYCKASTATSVRRWWPWTHSTLVPNTPHRGSNVGQKSTKLMTMGGCLALYIVHYSMNAILPHLVAGTTVETKQY